MGPPMHLTGPAPIDLMEDQNTTAAEQGAGTQTAENQTTEGTTNTGTQTAQTEEKPKSFTQDDVNRLLAKEKREWEKKVKDAEEKAKLSEDERTKAELEDAKRQLQERDRRDFVAEQAAKAGVKNAKLFYNAYKEEFRSDEKGVITNFNEVVAAARAESPELFAAARQGSADAGEGKGGAAPTFTLEQIRAMSPAEYLKHEKEIDKFLSTLK